MNPNAALLRLEQIRAKMDRGEELNEREVPTSRRYGRASGRSSSGSSRGWSAPRA